MQAPHPYIIQSCTPSDALVIASIQNECFDKKWAISEIKTLLESASILSYCLKNQKAEIVGYILCQWVLDEAEVISIAIKPTLQRQKLGTFLLKKLEDILIQNKIVTLYLDVSLENTPAKNFYQAQGYNLESIRPLYYLKFDGSYVDALVLRKKLLS